MDVPLIGELDLDPMIVVIALAAWIVSMLLFWKGMVIKFEGFSFFPYQVAGSIIMLPLSYIIVSKVMNK